MVVSKQDDNGKEIVTYTPPSREVLSEKCNSLVKQFTTYAEAIGLSPDEVRIQRSALPHIILRVDKREGYFVVFHDGTQINEIKQAALTAYWILKFRPFMINTDDPVRSNHYVHINEGFAAFYILSACKQYARENGFETKQNLSPHLKDELMYAFTYWDISKESMILISEIIGEAFFGVPTQGIGADGPDEKDT